MNCYFCAMRVFVNKLLYGNYFSKTISNPSEYYQINRKEFARSSLLNKLNKLDMEIKRYKNHQEIWLTIQTIPSIMILKYDIQMILLIIIPGLFVCKNNKNISLRVF